MNGQLLILVTTLVGASIAWAGEPHSARDRPPHIAISVARQPSAGFEDLTSTAKVESKEHQVSAGLYRFDVGDAVFDFGVDYQYTRYEYEGISGRNRDLHRLQTPLQFHLQRSLWRLEGYLAPGISTSSNIFKDLFKKASSDDVFVSARLEGRRSSHNRNWVIGLAYDRSFGEPSVYPVAGIELSPSDSLDVRLAFPDSGFRYQWSEGRSLIGRIFPAGHQWHVVSDELNDDFKYRVEAVRSQLSWTFRFWRQLSVDVSAGYEFGRSHHFTDDQNRRIDSDTRNQWLVAIGLRAGPAPLPYTHGGQF